MKVKLSVTRHTTVSELIVLGAFFESLALAREGHVSSISADEPLTAPVDPAELHEPETVVVQPGPAAGEEAPKRRRRSKAEIEAANAATTEKVVEAETGLFYWSHPESDSFGIVQTREELDKALAGDPCCEEVTKEQYLKLVAEAAKREVAAGNESPAPTQPAPQPDTQPSESASTEPASASPSDDKTYAAADVQQLATVVARTHGADLVKGKIAELGGTRIADLKQEQLNELGAFLAGVK